MHRQLRALLGKGRRVTPTEALPPGLEYDKGVDPARVERIAPFCVLVPQSGYEDDDGVCQLECVAQRVLDLCEAVRVVIRTQREKMSPQVQRLQPDCRPDRSGDDLSIADTPMEEIMRQASSATVPFK